MNEELKLKSNDNIHLVESQKEDVIERATEKYGDFLTALGFDWKNDIQMKDTPFRVAKMYVKELFSGTFSDEPNLKEFDNEGEYDGLVFSGNIEVNSTCAHHIIPFRGKAYVAYIPSKNGKVVGLSKLNRIVDFYCRRPQIQENLTNQIHKHLERVLTENQGIAVLIEADHLCVAMRGAKQNSTMITSKLSGGFMDPTGASRKEFYDNINFLKNKS